jgi:hypothetical protein
MSTPTVEQTTAVAAVRAAALRFTGKTLAEAVAKAEEAVGSKIVVVAANRVRRGGFAGFFATDVGVEVEVMAASGQQSTSFEEIIADAAVEAEAEQRPARAAVSPRALPDTSWLDDAAPEPGSQFVAQRVRRNGLATTWRRKAQTDTAGAEEVESLPDTAEGAWWSPPSKGSDGRRYAAILDVVERAAAVGVELSTQDAEALLESDPAAVALFEQLAAVDGRVSDVHRRRRSGQEPVAKSHQSDAATTVVLAEGSEVYVAAAGDARRGVASLATPNRVGVRFESVDVHDAARERLMAQLAAALVDDGFLGDSSDVERFVADAQRTNLSDDRQGDALVEAIAAAAATGPEEQPMVVPVVRSGALSAVATRVDVLEHSVLDADAVLASSVESDVSDLVATGCVVDVPAVESGVSQTSSRTSDSVAVFDAETEAKVADVWRTGADGARRRRQAGAVENAAGQNNVDQVSGVAEHVVSQLRTEGTRRISVRVATSTAAGETVAEVQWEGC